MSAPGFKEDSRERLLANLHDTLQMVDKVAFENVTHDQAGASILDVRKEPIEGRNPRGGPFGAALAISFADGSLEIVGKARGNNVIGSGIASQHAEDQAMQPDNYGLLIDRLTEFKRAGHEATVWMISSGQSCTTCHTKQEIMSRDLLKRDLLKPGHFNNVYGATYDDTLSIAQFYDAQYADAIIFAANYPSDSSNNLIKHQQIDFKSAPPAVQYMFERATSPTAAIVRNGNVYAWSKDQRTPFSLYTTAEVSAIQAACTRRRSEGVIPSWEIDGELYTMTDEIGPLLFAEAGWTKISTIKSVTLPLVSRQSALTLNHCTQTKEAGDTPNRAFLQIVSRGYVGGTINFYRDENFENRAQPMWAKVLKKNKRSLYNGAQVSPAVLSMRNIYTRNRFAAYNLSDYGRSNPLTTRRPLEYLR